jgi:hypothetical protein
MYKGKMYDSVRNTADLCTKERVDSPGKYGNVLEDDVLLSAPFIQLVVLAMRDGRRFQALVAVTYGHNP